MENQISLDENLRQRRLWTQKSVPGVSPDTETLTVQRLRRHQNGEETASPDTQLYELFPRLSATDQRSNAAPEPSNTRAKGSLSSKCRKRRRGREEVDDAEQDDNDENKVGENLFRNPRPRSGSKPSQELTQEELAEELENNPFLPRKDSDQELAALQQKDFTTLYSDGTDLSNPFARLGDHSSKDPDSDRDSDYQTRHQDLAFDREFQAFDASFDGSSSESAATLEDEFESELGIAARDFILILAIPSRELSPTASDDSESEDSSRQRSRSTSVDSEATDILEYGFANNRDDFEAASGNDAERKASPSPAADGDDDSVRPELGYFVNYTQRSDEALIYEREAIYKFLLHKDNEKQKDPTRSQDFKKNVVEMAKNHSHLLKAYSDSGQGDSMRFFGNKGQARVQSDRQFKVLPNVQPTESGSRLGEPIRVKPGLLPEAKPEARSETSSRTSSGASATSPGTSAEASFGVSSGVQSSLSLGRTPPGLQPRVQPGVPRGGESRAQSVRQPIFQAGLQSTIQSALQRRLQFRDKLKLPPRLQTSLPPILQSRTPPRYQHGSRPKFLPGAPGERPRIDWFTR